MKQVGDDHVVWFRLRYDVASRVRNGHPRRWPGRCGVCEPGKQIDNFLRQLDAMNRNARHLRSADERGAGADAQEQHPMRRRMQQQRQHRLPMVGSR
jgi:hypothetical protein